MNEASTMSPPVAKKLKVSLYAELSPDFRKKSHNKSPVQRQTQSCYE
jgi:hypothetical protein